VVPGFWFCRCQIIWIQTCLDKNYLFCCRDVWDRHCIDMYVRQTLYRHVCDMTHDDVMRMCETDTLSRCVRQTLSKDVWDRHCIDMYVRQTLYRHVCVMTYEDGMRMCETGTPPKNGEIALLLTTNGLMCSKYVSQTRNAVIENCQSYKMLLNFML